MNLYKLNKIVNLIVLFIFFTSVFSKIGSLGAGITLVSGIIYLFLYNIFISSSKNVVSKMVASRIKRGFDDNAKKILNYYLYYTLFVSAIVFVLFSIIPSFICKLLYKDIMCTFVLSVCGILFVIQALCDTLKSYYIGSGDSKIVVFSDVLKNVVLILSALFLLSYFVDYGSKVSALKNNQSMSGIYGAIGVVISFVIAFIVVFLVLLSGIGRLFKKDAFSFNEVRTKEGFKTFLKSFLPSLVKKTRNAVFPLVSYLIISAMYIRNSGENIDNAYSNIAILIVPITIIPLILILLLKEFAFLHIFQIRSACKKEDRKGIVLAYTNYTNASLTLVVPAFITLATFMKPINEKLYLLQIDNLLSLCIISSFIFLFAALDVIFTSGLEAVGLENNRLVGNIIALAVQLLFLIISLKNGLTTSKVLISFLLYYIVAMLIHGFFSVSEIGLKYNDCLAKLIKICISMIPMLVINIILASFLGMNNVIIIISILIGYTVFSIVFTVLHGFNGKELKELEGSFLYYYLKVLAGVFHIR